LTLKVSQDNRKQSCLVDYTLFSVNIIKLTVCYKLFILVCIVCGAGLQGLYNGRVSVRLSTLFTVQAYVTLVSKIGYDPICFALYNFRCFLLRHAVYVDYLYL